MSRMTCILRAPLRPVIFLTALTFGFCWIPISLATTPFPKLKDRSDVVVDYVFERLIHAESWAACKEPR